MQTDPDKAAMRRAARAARRLLSDADRRAATQSIRDRLRNLPELAGVGSVLVYAAGPSEVDISGVAEDLRARDVTTLYPRVRGEEMDLVAVDDPSALLPGHRGIPEPAGPASDRTTVDVALVPGVAFDLRGGRLGQGGGHYDRLLPRIGSARRVGIAFTCQIVPTVLRDDHDVPMDVVITEHSVHRVKSAESP